MFRRIGYLLSDLSYWLRSHLPGRRAGLVVAGIAAVGAVGVGIYLAADALLGGEDPEPAAAPQAVVEPIEADDEETEDLGFPAFATRNTTRVAGADPVAAAAAVALAAFPSTGGLEGPAAVTMVDVGDWPSAVAAGSLVAAPVSAPVLFTVSGEVPDLTASALAALRPAGAAETSNRQVFRIGGAAETEGLRTKEVKGPNPAELAAEIAGLRAELTGRKPQHLLIASSDEPAHAMPAAAWAARSGDPVLYAQRESVPTPTIAAIERNKKVPVFVLGPETAISGKALKELEKASDAKVERVGADDPVAGAIEFARYTRGSFGWNINDPGHGFVVASASRPADAGAAAALSAGGTWGPLLLTESVDELPAELRGYLLDLKPGYVEDPTRAVYNHIWVIGDPPTISVSVQAQMDELAEVTKVRSGGGGNVLGPTPGTPEGEPDPADNKDRKQNR